MGRNARVNQSDTFLFHGSAQASMINIVTEGLKINRPAAHGRLQGDGLYGAPDPRKSNKYARDGQDGRFVVLCRFNLSGARHMVNAPYDEYCVYDEAHVVPLWVLKIELA